MDGFEQQKELARTGQTVGACTPNGAILADPEDCTLLAFADGFAMDQIQPIGGTSPHDGDQNLNICPFDEGPHDGISPLKLTSSKGEIRTTVNAQEAGGRIHGEFQWCRWFSGPITLRADPTHRPPLQDRPFGEFRPKLGERISVVGDWALDKSETEIHEIRIGSTVRQDKDHPDLWYLFTSGFFARDTAQKDVLTVSVPVPLPKDLDLSSMKTDLNCSVAVTDVGCDNPGSAGITVVKEVDRDSNGKIVSGKCVIRADRDTSTDEALNERFCGIPFQTQDLGSRLKPRLQCPCFGLNQVAEVAEDQDLVCTDSDIANNLGRCNFDGFTDAHFQQPHHTSDATRIAFSRVIQAEWVDPLSLWTCNCQCDDPSSPGARINATVSGCADPAFKPDEGQDIQAACAQACEGTICGDELNCRIGTCHSNGTMSGSLVADDACDSTNRSVLVSSTGDFHVKFDPSRSVVQIGTVNGGGTFNADATTPAEGDIWLNATREGIELSEFVVAAKDFTINKSVGILKLGSASIQDSYGVIATRFDAAATGLDGGSIQVGGVTLPMPNFEVQPAQAKFTVHSTVNGNSGYANFVNDGPLEISVDTIKNTFVLSGIGKDGTSDNAVSLHLEGRIVNHPPVANSGGDRPVECSSYTTTPVALDGSASTDPDGNAIAHYQWFEGDAGLGNTAAVTAQATFGMHAYTLHVYDQDLAADAQTAHINVRDTTPPRLSAAASPACYWPPNHAFVKLDLTTDLHASAVDVCDPRPTVEIVSVTSDQAANAPGSGNTSPDFVFGPHTVCLRSERSGVLGARHYTIRVRARDFSGNSASSDLAIVVPHDQSQGLSCGRATGLDTPDDSCTR